MTWRVAKSYRIMRVASGDSEIRPRSGAHLSVLLFFQFRPPRIETIDRFLSFFHLRASVLQAEPVGNNRGIFQGRAHRRPAFFLLRDPLFDGGKLAGVSVG